MKNNLVILSLIAVIIASLASFHLGRHYYSLVPPEVIDLNDFASQMKPLLENDEARTKEKLTLLIAALESLDSGDVARAKEVIIDPLGRFYYQYTYENERYMNSEVTESLLTTMEQLGVVHPSFSKVIKFKPVE